MLELLRIQCPSCGIFLEVRNSKHEAVKKITCPNCQKRLAIDFQEKEPVAPPKPLEQLYDNENAFRLQEGINRLPIPELKNVELKVVRLSDGNSKCLVRVLNDDLPVSLNGEPLEKGDEVSLTIGDELKVGERVLTFGKPGKKHEEPKPEPKKTVEPEKPKADSHLQQWIVALTALFVGLVAVWSLWPSKEIDNNSPVKHIIKTDSACSKKSDKAKPQRTNAEAKGKKPADAQATKAVSEEDKSSYSDYELERLALTGDADAQFILGNRLIRQSGSSHVIMGVKYLRLAADQGSSKAQGVLSKAMNALRRQAEGGDSVAINILMSIDKK